MLSREKVIHNNLNKYIYILKIDSPKNISLNIRNFNYGLAILGIVIGL